MGWEEFKAGAKSRATNGIASCLHHTRVRRRGELAAARNERLKAWPARSFAIALVGGAVAVAIGLYPHYIRTPKNPGLIDEIFDSRTMVVAIRVVLLFAAGFVVVSLLARIWQRQWLSKAGPFEVSDVADLTQDLKLARSNLLEAEQRILALNDRIAASDQTIEELLEDLDASQAAREDDAKTIASLTERVDVQSSLVTEVLELIKKSGPPPT